MRETIAAAEGRRLPLASPAAPAGGTLLFLPFGQTDAPALRRLAAAAGEARTTPFRAFHVPPGCDPAGFISDRTDPRLRIAACAGAPACASGSTPVREHAAWLASHGITGVHVSGCAKGCAHPRATPTLVARQGRYDLVRHGRAGDAPDLAGLTLAQAAAALA